MKKDWWDKQFKVLMAFGASIVAGGWASSRERSWAWLLTKMINELQRSPVQLINFGIGASVISTRSTAYRYSGKPALNESLEKHVLSHKSNGNLLLPDLLILSDNGINDARGGTPIKLFCNELEDIVARIRKKIDPLIVLTGPNYIKDFDLGGKEFGNASLQTFYNYNEAIRKLSEKLGCLFVNLLSAYKEADWLVHYDGCHTNDLGHRIIANKIFEVLVSNCSGLARETRWLEKHIIPWRDEATLQLAWERDIR